MIAELGIRERELRAALLLQWGRDHVIAELKHPIPPVVQAHFLLQWGRDHVIAELTIFMAVRRGFGSFNGAAIM